ncbi:MAG: hypothetical protein AAF512_06400 [Pseudomonadota bacterium]
MKKKVTFGAKPSSAGARKSEADVPEQEQQADDWVAGETPDTQNEATTEGAAATSTEAETEQHDAVTNSAPTEQQAEPEPPQTSNSQERWLIIGAATVALALVYGFMQNSMSLTAARHDNDIKTLESAYNSQLQTASQSRATLTDNYEGQLAKLRGKMEARLDASEKAREKITKQYTTESERLRQNQAQLRTGYEERLNTSLQTLTAVKNTYEQQLIQAQQAQEKTIQTTQSNMRALKEEHDLQLKNQELAMLERQEKIQANFNTQLQQLRGSHTIATTQNQQEKLALQEKVLALETNEQSLQDQINTLKQEAQETQQLMQSTQKTHEKQRLEDVAQLKALQEKLANAGGNTAAEQSTGSAEGLENNQASCSGDLRQARAWFEDGAYQKTSCIYQKP